MKKILLSGCYGKMGQALQQLIEKQPELTIVAGIDRSQTLSSSFPVYQTLADVQVEADILIDFSHADNVPSVINYCVEKQLPAVIATTGLPQETQLMLEIAAKVIPVFYSANMSLGVNVLLKALQKITPMLEQDFDIEIVEKHHNQKKDAPSGTALLLADTISESCETEKSYLYGRSGNNLINDRSTLGIHAVRGGTIPGEHTVIYAGNDEIIELKHTALSRNIFAEGALKATAFLLKQSNGLYSMSDLLDETGRKS